MWKAPQISFDDVKKQVGRYWSPRQERYDPTMMGNSHAQNLDEVIIRDMVFDAAAAFFFSPWNKGKAKELEALVETEMGEKYPDRPTGGVKGTLSQKVFNSHAGSSQPSRYWGRYGGALDMLEEAAQAVKQQLPHLTDTRAWLEQHIKDVDAIRTTTEAMIHRAVKEGLKKLGLDDPSKYGGPQRTANSLRQAIQRVASQHPETRKHLVPLLRKFAEDGSVVACTCPDGGKSAADDELMGGRTWGNPDPHSKPDDNTPYNKHEDSPPAGADGSAQRKKYNEWFRKNVCPKHKTNCGAPWLK